MRTLATEYTVIAVDNRGTCGADDHGCAFSIEDMADDIVALADHLGIGRFLLAGHSMGGAIAQTVAYRHPGRVEALALCNTFARFGDRARRLCDDISELCRSGAGQGEILEAIVARVFSSSFLTPQLTGLVKSVWSGVLFGQSEYDYYRQASALIEFDSSPWVGSLRVPTLIVDSAEDELCLRQDADRLAELIVGARRTTLVGGHASPIEQPAAFCEALLSFFRTRSEGVEPVPRGDRSL
jgi:3-oxoadipate enol-lactonase